jgi:hypothetical protein
MILHGSVPETTQIDGTGYVPVTTRRWRRGRRGATETGVAGGTQTSRPCYAGTARRVFPFICPTSDKEKIPWPLANLEIKAKCGRDDFANHAIII